MDVGARRRGCATSGMVIVLALLTVACGARSSPEDTAPRSATSSSESGSTADSETVPDAEAVAAAEATLRAFFAVKGRAEDPISVRIDEQAVYLTSRDVHPTVPYEAGQQGRPSLITDTTVSVELSRPRMVGDEIMIDFEYDSSGVSYPMVGDEMQLDAGQPAEGYWDGTATLVSRRGAWLIDDLTIERNGGRVG